MSLSSSPGHEVGTIPVYGVSDLEAMLCDGTLPSADAIRYGFAIDDQLTSPTAGSIHRRHAKVAGQLLGLTGIIDDIVVCSEGKQDYQAHSPSHIDGLGASYYQAHTTLAQNHAAHTALRVSRYTLTVDEHQILQQLYAAGRGTSANRQIRELSVSPDGTRKTGLNLITHNRPADGLWRFSAVWGVTVVFPNGYDAKPGSEPSELFVHAADTESEDPLAALQYRRVVLSRLQRREDSQWLDGPRRRLWLPRRS
jgi:hypothetical protein